jgi:hypothetical protein
MSRRHHDFDNIYENRLHNALTGNQFLGHLACCSNGGGLKDDLQRSGFATAANRRIIHWRAKSFL